MEQSQPVKFSRYRSVRRATSTRPHQDVPAPAPAVPSLATTGANGNGNTTTQTQSAITRSRSRYRHAKPGLDASMRQAPPAAAAPAVLSGSHNQGMRRDVSGSHQQQAQATESTATVRGESVDIDDRERRRDHRARTIENGDATDRQRQDVMDHSMGTRSKSRSRSRFTRSRSASRRPTTGARDDQRDPESGSRGRSQRDETRARRNPESSNPTRSENDGSGTDYIEVGGGGIVPGIDAPLSAVNAGERKVLVKYRQSSIYLPVTPSTRAKDLLYTAADCLAGNIDPKTFIVLESFSQLGLERPLRRYERVRDVMNSWVGNGGNSLIIVPASSEAALEQLELKSAPINTPPEISFYMYHSHRLGKWEKRFVTLHPDGQVTMSKKERAKEQTNLCHLSDFDIYSTSVRNLPRKLTSSKRLCYAVKSMQKASMFLSTEMFVHYFATDDVELANIFHRAFQTWRSWYLVNKLGAGQKETATKSPRQLSPRHHQDDRSETYPIGHFRSLFDLSSLERESGNAMDQPQSGSRGPYAQRTSTREHAPPSSSIKNLLRINTDAASSHGRNPGTDGLVFSPTGLLGRTYSQRQQKMREREEKDKTMNLSPFNTQGLVHTIYRGQTSPHSLPSSPIGLSNSPSSSIRSSQGPNSNSGLKKSSSCLQRQKPLVDLSPVYQEPPQHARKGRAVKVEPGTALVDAATSPENPSGITIPPATTRRRPSPTSPPPPPQTTGLLNNDTLLDIQYRQRPNTGRDANPPPSYNMVSPTSPTGREVSPNATFAPNSLLARSGLNFAERGVPKGHGVATGNRHATMPLLNMSDMTPFAEHSLLRDLKA